MRAEIVLSTLSLDKLTINERPLVPGYFLTIPVCALASGFLSRVDVVKNGQDDPQFHI
jgi:hypothetical protein